MRRRLLVVLFLLTSLAGFSQGTNWTSLNGPYGGNLRDLVKHPNGNIFALVYNVPGIFRSTDSGTTWTVVELPANDPYINDIEIDASGKIYAIAYSILYASTDLGVNWITLNSSTGFNNASQIRKTGTNTLYVLAYTDLNGYQAVFKSTNDGASFTQPYTNTGNTNPINDIAIDGAGDVLLRVAALGIIRSAGGTGTYTQITTGGITTPGYANPPNDHGLIVDAAGTIFAIFNDNVFKSITNGVSWTVIARPGTETTFSSAVIAASPTGTSLFIYTNGHTYFSASSGGIGTWSPSVNLSSVHCLLAISTTSVLAGTGSGINVSTNSGGSWQASNNGLAGIQFNDMVYHNNSTWVVAPNLGLFTSPDQGTNWTESTSPEMMNYSNTNLLLLANNHILAFNGGCDVSIDGGTVWTNLTVPGGGLMEGYTYDGTTIYARSGNTFYKSINEGVSWGSALAITGLPSGSIYKYAVASNSIFVFLNNSSTLQFELWKISITTLAATKIIGLSFNGTQTYGLGKVIWAKGNKVYFYSKAIGGNVYQLSTSTDDGVTWTTQPVPLSNRFIIANNGYLTLSNSGNSFYFSRDDGANWVNLSFNYSSSDFIEPSQAVIDTQGYLYVLLDNKGLLKSAKPIVLPNSPTNLTNEGYSHNRVSLKWEDNSTNEKYFVIERSVGNNLQYDSVGIKDVSTLQTINKASIQQTSLTPNTTYYFRVKAVNDAGESIYSNEVIVTTLTKCAAAIPDNRSWSSILLNQSGRGTFPNPNVGIRYLGNGEYSITDFTGGLYGAVPVIFSGATAMPGFFTENCGVTHLYSGTHSGSTSRILSNGTSTFDPGTNTLTLKWQTDPRWYLSPNNPIFSETTVLTLNTIDPAPAAPTSVNASVLDDTGIQVQWAAGNYQKVYTVERALDAGFTIGFAPVGTVNYPTLTIVDRTIPFGNNITYFYRVRAANGNPTPLGSSNTAPVSVIFKKPYFTPITTIPTTLDIAISRVSSAFIDFNNDGLEDLYMASNGNIEPSFLMRNNGSGSFDKVLTNLPPGTFINSSWADFNNDGNIDLGGTRQDNSTGQAQVEIFSGNGDGTFTKVSGLPAYEYYFSGTFTWLDYNEDGKLDLLFPLISLVSSVNNTYNVTLHVLRNDGANGFADLILLDLGVGTGVFINDVKPADYDNDGDQDLLLVGFDSGGPGKNSRMLVNDGAGNFSTVAVPALNINGTIDAYAASWGDTDNDGDLDLFIAYYGSANALFKNNGNGTFTYMSADPVSNTVSNTYGGCFGDIDNDGDMDLFVSNQSATVTDIQFLYTNDGLGNFTQVSGEFATNYFRNNLTAAFGDYDKDGFLDLATAFPDKNNTILKNNKKITTAGNWSQIKLIGTVSNKSAIGARVSLTAAGKTGTREIQSNTGAAYNAQNSLIAHFGLGNAASINSITVSWPSGIVQTINAPPINQILTIAEDNTGPVISTLSPANATISVAVNSNLEITLTDAASPISAVAGKNILIYLSSNLITPVQTIDVNTLVQVGNKFTLDLPADLLYLTGYSVAIEAGAFKDIYGNTSLALATSSWSFTTIDNIPPLIAFTSVPTVDKGFASPHTFSATVMDNSGTVASATMSYRKISSKTFADLSGTFNTTTQKWDFPVQSSFFDETGINYYFTAKDGSNNITRLPATTGKYFVTRISYPASSPPTLALVKGNGAISGYQIISIPWEISNKDIAANFDELGSGDKKKYRFLRYHETPSPGWDEYPGTLSSFARGEGYFINLREVDNITLLNGESPKENRDTLFTLALKKGWNEIGNPYLTAIQWNDILAYNAITSGVSKLTLFGGTAYNLAPDPGVIEPYKGGFVQADNDVANLKIPFQGQTSGGRIIQHNFSKEISMDSWEVNFLLQQSDLEFRMGSIGMNPDANAGKDIFDMVVPPPLFEDRIEMSVAHPEHFMKRFARDVVSTQKEFMWEFTIDASLDAASLLSWDNSEFGVSSKELYLFDVTLQKAIDMREEIAYSFNPMESKKFRIYFGENLKGKIKPDKILLGKAFPNPSTGVSVIPFTLPEHSSSYQVRMEVFNMLGQKVGTLVEGQFKPGFYSTEWNTTEANLNNGLYTYRLVVSGQNLKDVQSGKIILMK